MASGQTTHYGLNQWQPEDAVLRTDFNADNAKTDAALNGLEQLIGTKEAALMAAISQRYGSDNPVLVSGSYLGTYISGGQVAVTINVGFRPALLVVIDCTQGDNSSEYALLIGGEKGHLIVNKSGNSVYRSGLSFSNTGFTISIFADHSYNFNLKGHTYCYFALR